MTEAVAFSEGTPRGGGGAALLRSVLRSPLGVASVAVLGLVVAVAILAGVLAPYDPASVTIDQVNAPPGGEYLLGGDSAGRDILSRLLFGARNTLIGAGIAVTIAIALGVTSGLIAGYFGGFFDTASSWVVNMLMALPAMIVLLAFFQVLGTSVFMSMVVFGVMLTPGFFRLVRNQVMDVRDQLFVDAARVAGLHDGRIIGRHILRVIRAPIVIQAAHAAGVAIVIQSGLEFLGLGDPGTPTWGGMLQDAFTQIYVAPTSIVWPGGMIAVTVASLALLGNAVRDALQRTSSTRRRRRRHRPGPPEDRRPETAPATHSADRGALLSVRDLSIAFPAPDGHKEAVSAVGFDVARGEVVGIVGESGSGKTQTAFAILGLLADQARITSGSITFDGRELTTMRQRELNRLRGGHIAYIPQEPMSNLDPSFRIGSQLVEPMRSVLGIGTRQAERRALELLDRVGIADPRRTYDSFPHQVSGGMAQRVLIAGAVSCGPDLLIADEPTTALDVTVQAEVLDVLRRLQSEDGMGMMLVTHNFGVVADICDRVVVMQQGKIVEANSVHELFRAPTHPYTRMLLDSTLDDSTPRRWGATTVVTE